MKKAKVLLALTALLCVVLMFGACGKELKATEVYSGKYDNTTEVYTKSEEKFSGATSVYRENDDYFIVVTEKEVDTKDLETNEKGDGFVLVDDKITANVITVYDASYNAIKSFEETFTVSLSSDAKTVTGQTVEYEVSVDTYLDVDVIVVEKTVTSVSMEFGSDFESEEETTTAYFYTDGNAFIDFTEIKSTNDNLGFFFEVNGTYYYEKDGKLAEAFKEDVFGNKKNLATKMDYRLGDTFYKETDYGVKVYNAALEQIACYEFDALMTRETTACVILPDGNVIVQYATVVPEDGTKYDYIDEYGDFYKLTTVLLNVEKNKAKEVSFDYVIDDFETVGIYVDGEKTEKIDGVNEEINCVVYGYPVQEYIDFDKSSKLIVLKDDGTAKGVVADLIENQEGYATVIGENLYMVEDVFGNVYTVSGLEDSSKNDITLIRKAFNYGYATYGDYTYSREGNYVIRYDEDDTYIITQYGVSVTSFERDKVAYIDMVGESLLVTLNKSEGDYKYYIICGNNSTPISAPSGVKISSASVIEDYVYVTYIKEVDEKTYSGFCYLNENGADICERIGTDDYYYSNVSLSKGVVTMTKNYYKPAEGQDATETIYIVFAK